MIVVISCAASKNENAGTIMSKDGKPVKFIAHPEKVPEEERQNGECYARPDDRSDTGGTWRERLVAYNNFYRESFCNPRGLLKASELYKNKTYRELVSEFLAENVYILSAGWGLVKSDFLLPDYDVTFSKSSKIRKAYRRDFGKDTFKDFNQMPPDTKDTVAFFGGKDYVPLFCELTKSLDCRKVVFQDARSSPPPEALGTYEFMNSGVQGMNWYYGAAREFINGDIGV